MSTLPGQEWPTAPGTCAGKSAAIVFLPLRRGCGYRWSAKMRLILLRLGCMNRHGLANLNRRQFSDVQLEVIRLYRAHVRLKEWFDPDAWISNIAYQEVRA